MTDEQRALEILSDYDDSFRFANDFNRLAIAIENAFKQARIEGLPSRDEYTLMEKERLAILSEPKFENSKEWLNAYTQGLRWAHVWYQNKMENIK